MNKTKNKYLQFIISFIMLTVGTVIAAYALESFLIPNTILDGGVTGISIIVSKVTNIPLSILVLLINVEPLTEQILLATVFGGVLLGVGVGLIIHFGGCVDGTESVAIVISKKTSLSVGQVVLCFNLIIYTVAGFIFGLDRALYSLLTYFITFKVIDFVSEGLEQAKAALIVTSNGTALAEEIYKRLGRTVTFIKGQGLISGDKEVLYCVLTRIEIFELKKIVEEMDDRAFITILEVSEVIGEHIKSTKKIKKVHQNIKNLN